MSFDLHADARTLRMALQTPRKIKIDPARLRRVADHESGHAVMAVIQRIPCKGIFFQYQPGPGGLILGGKFCTIVNHSQPWHHPDYLQAAAGAASEKLFLGGYDPKGSEDDRANFSNTEAPSWDDTVEEAKTILEGKKQKIELMAQVIMSLHENIAIDQWPDQRIGGIGFRTMLGAEVISAIVESDPIPTAVADFFDQIGFNLPNQDSSKPSSADPPVKKSRKTKTPQKSGRRGKGRNPGGHKKQG